MTEEKTVQPGDSYQRSIPVKNISAKPVDIKVYQTDYSFSANGENHYDKPGQLARSNASWLTVPGQQYTIPANGQIVIDYSVQIPHDDLLTGTYWSMIMIEPIAQDSPESSVPGPDQIRSQLSQVMRYGIQVVTHIADSGASQLKFENLSLLKKEGQRVFTVDIKNTGDRWTKPKLSVELYDMRGQPVGKWEGERKRLYPDTSAHFQVDLENVSSGQYVALVVADGGGDDLFGTQIEFDLR